MNINEGAPRAERIPFERTFHGHTFTDHYEWLREDEEKAHSLIDAENAWFDQNTADQAELREQIVAELSLIHI